MRRVLSRPMIGRLSRYIEARTLVPVALVSGAVAVFAWLASEVLEGDTRAFDERLLLLLRNPANPADPLGPGWIQEMGRDFTALGGTGVLTVITLAVAVFLRLQGSRRSMWLVIAAVGSGLLLSSLLKTGFARPRPDLVPHGSIVYTASFPSGHAMLSAVTYLTLATLLARVQERRAMKAYILSLAAVLTLLVGVSRVYLGVHWPTDVAAGWALGSAWALLWWIVAGWLERPGAAEAESP